MKKGFLFVLLSIALNVSWADTCVKRRGSCVDLVNYSAKNAKLHCNLPKNVHLTANSQQSDAVKLDGGMSDGLGEPSPGNIRCTLNLNNTVHEFNFNHSAWGPVISFELREDARILAAYVFDRWRGVDSLHYFKLKGVS